MLLGSELADELLEIQHRLRMIFLAHDCEPRRFEGPEAARLQSGAPQHQNLVRLKIVMADDEVVLGEIRDVSPSRARFEAEVDARC